MASLWGTIPILAIIILGVYFKFRLVDRENETPTPQIGNQLGKCILTTSINSEDESQLGSNQSEPSSSSPGAITLTEDTGGCLNLLEILSISRLMLEKQVEPLQLILAMFTKVFHYMMMALTAIKRSMMGFMRFHINNFKMT